jgi:hypothetical protein
MWQIGELDFGKHEPDDKIIKASHDTSSMAFGHARPVCYSVSVDHSTAAGRLISGGHDDAAQRALLGQPTSDLPCPSFMILPDWWESARFQAVGVALSYFRQNGGTQVLSTSR